MTQAQLTSICDLTDRYDCLLLDSYGVLVNSQGALPGARELIARLTETAKSFCVVTNDASRLPSSLSRRFDDFGLRIPPSQIVTAGSLIAPYFSAHGLTGNRCVVLGPSDSIAYVSAAGGEVIPIEPRAPCDVVLVCDEDGFEFLQGVEDVLSAICHAIDTRGEPPRLVLPNPDIIYPKGAGGYGFTSGGIAVMIETALARRYPDRTLRFERLGKPEPLLFELALQRAGSRRAVMVGDQLETDIAGAQAAGIATALLETGVSVWNPGAAVAGGVTPTYRLENLMP